MTDKTTTPPGKRLVTNNLTRCDNRLSVSEQQYILEGCRDDCRLDGRRKQDVRHCTILTANPLILSNGSSRVVASGTEILCSVKAELVKPHASYPNEGAVDIHVDIGNSGDSGSLSKKTRRIAEQQLQATLNFLLARHLVPVESLCILSGQYVWKLHCDLIILSQAGGNIIDVCSWALRAALGNTRLPHIVPTSDQKTSNSEGNISSAAASDLAVESDVQKAHLLPTDDSPIVISVSVCKCPPKGSTVLVLDMTPEEELCVSSIVRIGVTPQNKVISIQLQNGGSLPVGFMSEVQTAAIQAAQCIFDTIDKHTTSMPLERLLQSPLMIR